MIAWIIYKNDEPLYVMTSEYPATGTMKGFGDKTGNLKEKG